jgi:hypothetical protein
MLRPVLALALAAAFTTASLPASAQVGMPPPPGADPAMGYGGYAAAPQTRSANPVALGFGISLMVVGAGMLAGGFAALAMKDANPAVSGALLGVGGGFFAASVPLVIMGAQQVPVSAPGGYGPQMSRGRWIGSPRILFPNPREGRPAGLAWVWQL